MKPIVVWDMGGIMYRYFTEMIIDVGIMNGWPIDQMPLGPTNAVPDPNYVAMDAGQITEPDYLAATVEMLSTHGIQMDPPTDLDWSDELRPTTWQTIGHLHDLGYRQGLLTNDATKWLGEDWWETWDRMRFFDAVIDIKMIGIRKPAPEPYLASAEQLGVDPSACLFVDDMHTNCEGAEAVGMQSLWYDICDPAGSMHRLRQRLGLSG